MNIGVFRGSLFDVEKDHNFISHMTRKASQLLMLLERPNFLDSNVALRQLM